MRAHSLDSGAIASACEHASVRLEGDENGTDLGPCQRCSAAHPKKLVTIAGAFREHCDGRERVLVFSRCSTNCNTSRLHVGGRVVLVVTVRGPCGPLAEAVSAPLSLVSRSTYVHRPRRPLATPRITWVDYAEGSCGPSTAFVAQERPASAVGSAESSGEEEEAAGCAASPSQGNEDLRVTLLLLLQLQAEQLERVHQLERLVALVCDALWMRAHSLDSGAIASACEHASVRLEGDEHGTDLEPCRRCCTVHPKKLVNIAGAFLEHCDGRERVVVFPRCSTPRRPLAAPRITWVDYAEGSCGPSTAIVAQERPASAVGSAESSGEEEEAVGCAASPSQGNEDLRLTLLLLLQLQAEQLERVHQLERLVHWDLQY
eukprot:m51a1_g1017 hypothetical protein (374) ;mRNA; f:630645-635005